MLKFCFASIFAVSILVAPFAISEPEARPVHVTTVS